MIDREKLSKIVDAMEKLDDFDVGLSVNGSGRMSLTIYVKGWWSGTRPTEERRHQVLALVTPLVGKMEKEVDGTDIGYKGQADNLSININRIDKCTILGYKKVTKRVPKTTTKMVEEEVETGEFEDEEELLPITDCQVRMGQASESDVEVPA